MFQDALSLTVPLIHSRMLQHSIFLFFPPFQVKTVREIPFQSTEVTNDLEDFVYSPAPAADAGVKTTTAV